MNSVLFNIYFKASNYLKLFSFKLRLKKIKFKLFKNHKNVLIASFLKDK